MSRRADLVALGKKRRANQKIDSFVSGLFSALPEAPFWCRQGVSSKAKTVK
jgi:hypothetical protein